MPNLENAKFVYRLGIGSRWLLIRQTATDHGFDLNAARIAELEQGHDSTREVSSEELASSSGLKFTNTLEDLREYNVFIIAVPTPIDASKRPDLTPLESASSRGAGVVRG